MFFRPARWDVVLSADTLVYFGDLTEVLAAACTALRVGGWMAFTLEALDTGDARAELASSGRYRHARRHVEQALATAGFVETSLVASALRKEVGEPVAGWVVLARKGDAIGTGTTRPRTPP